MKITPWFTQAILGVYDFLLSDKYILSYLKNRPGSSKLEVCIPTALCGTDQVSCDAGFNFQIKCGSGRELWCNLNESGQSNYILLC